MSTSVTYSGRSIIWNKLKGGAGATEPLNVGWGVSAITGSANSDVALFKPSGDLEARVAGTSTLAKSVQLADTYQVVGTLICASNSKSITEGSLHDTAVSLSPTTTWSTAPTTSAGTTGTVVSSTGFPGSGNYYIQSGNEVMLVTGGQGSTTWTVTRGVNGSTAATIATSQNVTLGGDGSTTTGFASISTQTANVSSTQGGDMFLHADFAGIGLNVSDSLQLTIRVQLS